MAFLVSIALFTPARVGAQDGGFSKTVRLNGADYSLEVSQTPKGEEYGYFMPGSEWPKDFDGLAAVQVCWENPAPEFERERALVRDAVQSTWVKYSRLEFRGWRPCAARSRGIRIFVTDDGPYTKGLGRSLDGVPQGMVLNFTFGAWSPSCASPAEYRDLCIKSIAVHEFGHGVGFVHEHNRHDRPGECIKAPQGTSEGAVPLTPYDPSSVMNYCNPNYNNNGELSALDIEALQKKYGKN